MSVVVHQLHNCTIESTYRIKQAKLAEASASSRATIERSKRKRKSQAKQKRSGSTTTAVLELNLLTYYSNQEFSHVCVSTQPPNIWHSFNAVFCINDNTIIRYVLGNDTVTT